MGAASSRMGASSSRMPAASSMPAEPVVYRVIQTYCPERPGKQYTVARGSPEYLIANSPSFDKYIQFTDPPATDRDGITTQRAKLRLSIQLEEENKVVFKEGDEKYFQPIGAPVTVLSSPTRNQIVLDCGSIQSYVYTQNRGIVYTGRGGRKTKRTRRSKKKSKGKTRRSKA